MDGRGFQASAIGFGCRQIGGGYGRVEETEFAQPRARHGIGWATALSL